MARLIKHNASTQTDEAMPGDTDAAAHKRTSGAVIQRQTFEAKGQAEKILAKAQAQAQQIIDDARTQSEAETLQAQEASAQAHQEAQERGYREGLNQGTEELNQAVANLVQRSEALDAQVIPQLRDLAMAVARRVIHRELEFHPEAVVHMVRQTLADKARQRTEITLRVHPDDYEIVREHRRYLADILSRCREIQIIEDPQVARHGVIIETEAGTVDAQLETQLQALESAMAASK